MPDTAPTTSPEPDYEDDVAELVDWIATETLQGDSTEATKDQLRDALSKLIDSRIAAAAAK